MFALAVFALAVFAGECLRQMSSMRLFGDCYWRLDSRCYFFRLFVMTNLALLTFLRRDSRYGSKVRFHKYNQKTLFYMSKPQYSKGFPAIATVGKNIHGLMYIGYSINNLKKCLFINEWHITHIDRLLKIVPSPSLTITTFTSMEWSLIQALSGSDSIANHFVIAQ